MEKKYITKAAVQQVISDYWAQLRKYPLQSLIAIGAPGIGSIFVFYVPPLMVAKIVDIFAKDGRISVDTAFIYVTAFGLWWLLGEAFWRLGLHFLIKVEVKAISTLAKKSYTMLSGRDYAFYTDNFTGTLSKKAFAYSRNFESLIDTITFNVSSNFLPLFFVIYILWGYSPWIPTILVLCITVVLFVAIPIIRKRAVLVAERHDASSKMVGRLSDTITNILTVKSFAKEQYESDKFSEFVDDYGTKAKKSWDYQNLRHDIAVSPVYVLTNVIGLVAAIFFAQKLGLQAGGIVIVFSYYSQVTRVFWNINGIYRHVESAVSEAAEFTQLFVDDPAIMDVEGAKTANIHNGEIIFENVNFDYCDDDEKCFLTSFNLVIKDKEKIGLVGPSGGGKTTITKLLLRFVDPKSGNIIIDGNITKDITQASLRNGISYVPQEPLLFHRSLYENISYADDKATKKEVLQAAKTAHADEFIDQLPLGYDTLVGERGIKLSGGQKQRVAIARALLKKAPILVLDEATSALDSESEKYIQEGLWELMKDKTAIVIAHRLSTIKHLDRILVLDEGKIVQDGTHQELIKQDGLYKKLWSHQSNTSEFV